MLILTLRTDKPEAEVGLYQDEMQVVYETWQAHRLLAETIHTKVKDILDTQHKTLQDLEGLACYKGPGSFTGLRIGLTVANALAYSLAIPVVAARGNAWQQDAIRRLLQGENETIALPEYGAPVFTTQPKK